MEESKAPVREVKGPGWSREIIKFDESKTPVGGLRTMLQKRKYQVRGKRNQVLSRGNTKLEGKKVLFRRKKEKD